MMHRVHFPAVLDLAHAAGVHELLPPFPHEPHDQRRPAGLVGGSQALAGFRVEVFVEQQEVLSVLHVAVALGLAEARPVALGIRLEE